MQRKWKRRWQRMVNSLVISSVTAVLLSCYSPVLANPTGGAVTSGSANITTNGLVTTINQATNTAAINWQSFNIASGEKVQFIQPSASAVALNRVVGNDASAIYGTLSANGKVFLMNPNGILFAPGAQVNVGGLVASTLPISDQDFEAGNYHFKGSGGAVINQGNINAESGGYVALLGGEVSNQGIIVAKQGAVVLGAGNGLTLDMNGDGLLNLTVDKGALKALAENKNLIEADGGLVIMTSKSADTLAGTVVNNSGVIKARSVSNKNGVIRLEGGTTGKVENNGTLDATGKEKGQTGGTVKVLGDMVSLEKGTTIDVAGDNGGGTILVGGNYQGSGREEQATTTKVAKGATLNADAITQGTGGTVVVWAKDATNFAGEISAKGGKVAGDGGQVETSGKQTLSVSGTVDASAFKGAKGKWLLDPNNVTIQTGGSDANVTGNPSFATTDDNAIVTTNSIETALNGGTNVTITTAAVGSNSQEGNIDVDNNITWNTGSTLTLSAHNNINLKNSIVGTNGGLTLRANTGGLGNGLTTGIISPWAGSNINVKTFTLGSGTWRELTSNLSSFSASDFRITGGTFIRGKGGNGLSATPYQIADVYGLQGIGSSGMLAKNYQLVNNINASGTSGWYSGAADKGFVPIGTSTNRFTGSLDGKGFTISGLSINRPNTDDVGLFGFSQGVIRDVGLIGGSVTGKEAVGGLVGILYPNGKIHTSYNTGTVHGYSAVGGLVGFQWNGGITSSYGTGVVSGTFHVGGLVGINASSAITSSYSTGGVSGSVNVGGFVGKSDGGITNCYWDKETSGQPTTGIANGTNSGVIGLTTAQMKTAPTASTDPFYGWDFTNSWRMYDGKSYPLLKAFLTQLTVTAMDTNKTYDSAAYNGTPQATYSQATSGLLLGTLSYGGNYQGATNAGEYAITPSGLYSTSQQGYDISYVSGKLTIGQRGVTVTPDSNQHRVYDGTANTPLLTYTTLAGGLVNGDTLSGILSRTAGSNAGSYAITQGTLANSNYNITIAPENFTIDRRGVTITPDSNQHRVYDGTVNTPLLTYTTSVNGLVNGDTLSGILSRDTGANVGNYGITQGTLTNGNNGNYSIAFTSGVNFGIDRRGVTITPDSNQHRVYDGTANTPALTYTTSANGLVNGETLNGILSRDAGTNAGNYGITQGTLTNDNNGNYNISFTPGVNFGIDRRGVTVTPDSNQHRVYDGTVNTPLLTYTTSANGLVNGDILSGILSRDAGSNAGNYAITQGTLTNGNNGNYNITVAPENFTIDRRGVTVTPDSNQHRVYDGTVNTPLLTYTTSANGLVNDDTLSGVLSRDAGSNAGNYAITQGTLTNSNNGNYNISLAPGVNFAIDRRTLTITANNATKYVGQVNPTFTFSSNGLVTGDNQSSLGTLIFETAANITSPVGSYAVTPSGLSSDNYNIGYVNGMLTVEAFPATIFPLPVYDSSIIYTHQTNSIYPGRGGQTLSYFGSMNGYLTRMANNYVPLTIISRDIKKFEDVLVEDSRNP